MDVVDRVVPVTELVAVDVHPSVNEQEVFEAKDEAEPEESVSVVIADVIYSDW